jgi:hypothetical protein
MSRPAAAGAALILWLGAPAHSHRLDEYLQASVISLERSHVQVELRLTPGVAILPVFLAVADRDADGVISESEQRAYAARVLREISLTCDGHRVPLRVTAAKFPPAGEMKEGLGEIQLEFQGTLRGASARRSLTFENRHLAPISAYLVNSLVPRDPEIRITGQKRNFSQSVYQVDYAVDGVPSNWGAWACLAAAACLLFGRYVLAGPNFAARERLVLLRDRSEPFVDEASHARAAIGFGGMSEVRGVEGSGPGFLPGRQPK